MTAAPASWADWPELLRRIADGFGAGAALTFAATYGGREVYIPRASSIDETHHLAQALGLATARALAAEIGAGRLMVPLGPSSSVARRKALMRQMTAEKLSAGEIARALGMTRRAVEIRRQRDRELGLERLSDPNLDLFES